MEQFLFILQKQGLSPVLLYDLTGQIISIQVVIQGIVYDILEVYRDTVLGRTTLGELFLLRDDLVKEQEKQEILVDKQTLKHLLRGVSASKDREIQRAISVAQQLLKDSEHV